jgi:hypothetical protein
MYSQKNRLVAGKTETLLQFCHYPDESNLQVESKSLGLDLRKV